MKRSNLFFVLLCISTLTLNAQWTGSGTSSDPYQISTVNDLKALSSYVMNDADMGTNDTLKNTFNKSFKLMNDIDMTGITDFTPIGGFSAPKTNNNKKYFAGNFDGNNHKINKLTLYLNGYDYVGFFGILKGSVSNLGLEKINIVGINNVGGLVAVATSNKSISNCYVTGSISASKNTTSSNNVGGLVGTATVNIFNSHFSGNIISNHSVNYGDGTLSGYIGGLVGTLKGTISECYSTGSISNITSGVSFNFVGGLIGMNDYPSSISNSYSTMSITSQYSGFAAEQIGGIGGFCDGISLFNTYFSGTLNINGNGDINSMVSIAGLVSGYPDSYVTISNSYFNGSMICNCTASSDNLWIGGLSGGGTSVISNSYSSGSFQIQTPKNSYIGGIAANVSTIENSYSAPQLFSLPQTSGSNYGIATSSLGSTIRNTYYLDIPGFIGGKADTALVIQSENFMKSQEMINLLNKGQNAPPWIHDTSNTNHGFPILSLENNLFPMGMEKIVSNELSIYPNPINLGTSIELKIFNQETSEVSRCEIFDCTGSLISNNTLSSNIIPTDRISNPGLYILKVELKNGTYLTGKLLVK